MPTDAELIDCWKCDKTYDKSIQDHCPRCDEKHEDEPQHIDEHEEEK